MVVIRLRRIGKRSVPYYRIVVADRRSPRDGKFIEQLGTYNPHKKEKTEKIALDGERASYWLKQGAQPSVRVASFFKELGIK
jgi:small subunit ribosomal protein S16